MLQRGQRESPHAYATAFTVRKVDQPGAVTHEAVVAEVERLNALNADKGVTYYWQTAKLFDGIGDAATRNERSSG